MDDWRSHDGPTNWTRATAPKVKKPKKRKKKEPEQYLSSFWTHPDAGRDMDPVNGACWL